MTDHPAANPDFCLKETRRTCATGRAPCVARGGKGRLRAMRVAGRGAENPRRRSRDRTGARDRSGGSRANPVRSARNGMRGKAGGVHGVRWVPQGCGSRRRCVPLARPGPCAGACTRLNHRTTSTRPLQWRWGFARGGGLNALRSGRKPVPREAEPAPVASGFATRAGRPRAYPKERGQSRPCLLPTRGGGV